MSSARVGWLVQELEEENSSLQEELKGITDERDLLRREVDRQRRLLKNCVEEVFALKDELSHLLETHCSPDEAQRQQRLCERLAKHVTDIEKEVAEKGARAAAWRAERDQREATVKELEASLDRQTQESRRLNKDLEDALLKAEKQSHEYLHKIAELEETVDSVTKQKAQSEAKHAKEVEQLKHGIGDAEKSVKLASASQQQLLQARKDQERQQRVMADLRQKLAQRDASLADTARQLTERANQLSEARRTIEVKAAQVIGLKSSLQDAKNRAEQLQKELEKKAKEDEVQVRTINKKEGIIQRQKSKLEEVAKDLNKLKAVFSDQEIPGLCACNEGALGGSLLELRALRGGRLPPPCAAPQLRQVAENLRKQLATSQVRTRQLERSLDEIRQKLPQMSAEADRAYIELQTRLKDSQSAQQAAQAAQQEQLKRGQHLMLKLAATSRKLKDSEQLVARLRQENKSLITNRVEWERTSNKLQSALHETVQLTARLQAIKVELEAERKLTAQLRKRLDQADAQMKCQLNSIVNELHQVKQTSGSCVDWSRKYEVLLDKCQQWQEECLARHKDCQIMEQRLGEMASQQPEKTGEVSAPSADEQARQLELQLQTLLRIFNSLGRPEAPVRARSVPDMPLPVPRLTRWDCADTSSGSLRTDERVHRERTPSPSRSSQTSLLLPSRRQPGRLVLDQQHTASALHRPPSNISQKTAPPATGRTASSVPLPDLAPLMTRVAEVVQEMERQRDRGRRSAHQEQEEEEPCRDSGGAGRSARCGREGGDDGRPPAVYTVEDAQTQSGLAAVSGGAALSDAEDAGRRRRSTSRRRDHEQLEKLAHFKALQELLNKMAAAPQPPSPGSTGPEVTVPDLTELRAQWRRLETMVRDEAESARTRSDVILRMSGISESSNQQ